MRTKNHYLTFDLLHVTLVRRNATEYAFRLEYPLKWTASVPCFPLWYDFNGNTLTIKHDFADRIEQQDVPSEHEYFPQRFTSVATR